ncbi:hypothetical protein GCM10010168_38300 [Actinoplanes ianthinogenes]|uniref:DUF7824 domain-containing protein n=1 Tax=Actinoplanes ianthinogenes TaxID=122358 RepID=A0ABN6CN93_9ACTN|nr:DUF6493 family protein [Actinoplanes ianthinogenes]BCJ46647.1 hypothetical protein Aiant_73040 [Actinoplanes ianthinogenes]GGR16674.1 hypothetical protein GCM10010168_38300 [Actinoplanes ianthinogenes]
MTLTWEALQRRAKKADTAGVIALLVRASEEERVALAKDVEAGVRAEATQWWRHDLNPMPGYALAVIGCMPTAARAAALLLRTSMQTWTGIGPERFLELARFRRLPWLGELGTRLATRLPTRDADEDLWPMIAALLREGRAEPPVRENVARAWLANLLTRPHHWDRRLPPLSMRLRDDPHRDTLLPALFEFDGLAADLAAGSWDDTAKEWTATPRLPAVLAHLIGEGTLERKTYLDLTVDRLLRGGKPHDLRPFVLLHDLLEPTLDELSSHALDYARLLPDAPGTVAALAQKALRTVDDAGRLELETLLDTSGPTLVRKEKTLVKSQLTWLDKVSRRHPDRAGEVLETVAAAFGHPALDVQDRALTLIGKQTGKLDADTVARLADASAVLAGDLPRRAAELFGTMAEAPAEVPELPPAAPPAELPAPIATPGELAEELVALCHEETAIAWERVLAGLVSLYATDGPAALATALRPVLERYSSDFEEHSWNHSAALTHLGVAIRSALGTAKHGSQWQRLVAAVRRAWQDGRRGGEDSPLVATPDGVLGLRVAEVASQLTSTMVPMVVATPTHVTGSLDPAVLLERLRRAEAEGWQPWPVDFEQALLRLPREPDPAVVEQAATLTSPAGRQFAAWLAGGGLPDPISRRWEQRPLNDYYYSGAGVARRVVTILGPARDGGLRLERQLLTTTPGPEPRGWPDDFVLCGDVLAMTLPHHREAIASWVLPELAALADQDQRRGAEVLPLLAACSGPVGPALAYGIAYTLGARHPESRVAAVDAFLTLAARPEPFAAAVGAALGDVCADGMVKLSRLTPALAEAHLAGASLAVWEVLAAALPALLPTAQRGLPDLLELSTQVAGAVHARTEIAGLAEVAARTGSTRLVKEAKRLHSVLHP